MPKTTDHENEPSPSTYAVHDADPGRTEPVPTGIGGMIGRVFAVLFVLFCVAFWIYAFSPWARDRFQAPDGISDAAYVTAIETRCAAAVATMDELPSIRSATSPQDRATYVDLANGALAEMRTDLGQLNLGTPDDRELVSKWLADWDIYIEDREVHANKLRAGNDERFLNTERDNIFIAERMSGFARRNNIRSCMPPGDL